MIHEIFPHSFSNSYLKNYTPEENDYILYFKDDFILLKELNGELRFPQKADIKDNSFNTETIFLFTFNEHKCFIVFESIYKDMVGFVFKEISFFRTTKQQEIAWISLLGYQMKNWYLEHRFCGKCGSATRLKTEERALICTQCETTIYPKISPAIIVAIISGDKILLARNSNFAGSRFSLIAGYVDIGETLEETIRREVKEEVGIAVKNIRYYKSQPWPLSSSMMIGYVAEADENETIHIDNNEIAEAAWFTRGNLPEHSLNLSIAGEMIEKFEKGEL